MCESTMSSQVITQLKSTFSLYGIPNEVISDNGPRLSNGRFKQFAESWEFKHTTTSPKHPQANGQVEKDIGTTKSVLDKAYEDGTESIHCLAGMQKHYDNRPELFSSSSSP